MIRKKPAVGLDPEGENRFSDKIMRKRTNETPELLGVEPRYKGWSRLLVASVRLTDGHIITREIEDHGNAVCVLPYDPIRRTALVVRQFRAPVLYAGENPMLIEAIAGLAETEDPAGCVRREAMEEAGLRLTAVELVVRGWSMPGISSERMDLFLAEYSPADRVAAGGGLIHEHEDIEVLELPLQELAEMANGGKLTDMKTLALVQTLRLRKPELFAG
jgi:nudix-type nucleoside diphosphatase (YffH/AdpP family)